MTPRPGSLLLLEDITDPRDATGRLDGTGRSLPIRTVRDRHGNHFVLLSVGTYVRLLSRWAAPVEGSREGSDETQ